MNRRAEIIGQIDNLFGDTSQPASATRNDLEHIIEHAQNYVDTLDAEGVDADDD